MLFIALLIAGQWLFFYPGFRSWSMALLSGIAVLFLASFQGWYSRNSRVMYPPLVKGLLFGMLLLAGRFMLGKTGLIASESILGGLLFANVQTCLLISCWWALSLSKFCGEFPVGIPHWLKGIPLLGGLAVLGTDSTSWVFVFSWLAACAGALTISRSIRSDGKYWILAVAIPLAVFLAGFTRLEPGVVITVGAGILGLGFLAKFSALRDITAKGFRIAICLLFLGWVLWQWRLEGLEFPTILLGLGEPTAALLSSTTSFPIILTGLLGLVGVGLIIWTLDGCIAAHLVRCRDEGGVPWSLMAWLAVAVGWAWPGAYNSPMSWLALVWVTQERLFQTKTESADLLVKQPLRPRPVWLAASCCIAAVFV